jgi:hypothetical protein
MLATDPGAALERLISAAAPDDTGPDVA